MAKGEISFYFYFDTLADLQAQLLETLGLGARVPDAKLAAEYVTRMEQAQAPRGELSCVGAGMSHNDTRKEPETVDVTQKTEPVSAVQSASGIGISEDVRKANQEAAAAEMAAAKAAALQQAAAAHAAQATAQQAAQPVADPTPTAQGAETLTVETLPTVEYPELLAYCERHPEAGIDPTKCAAKFFRPMVEFKLKAFLETQVK